MLKDGKPFLAMSTPGGDLQDQTLLQVFLNIVEFNMSPQEAIESPRFDSAHLYASFDFHEFPPGKLNVERRIPQATIDKLIAWDIRLRWSAIGPICRRPPRSRFRSRMAF